MDGKVRVGEVQYFTRLAVHSLNDSDNDSDSESEEQWKFNDVAILRLYSEPDSDLLGMSSQVLAVSTLLDDIYICDVQDIRSVVAMIPHDLTLPSDISGIFFCMMEKPGIDISDLGVPYSFRSEASNDENDDFEADLDVE